jgi:hypothetical protein
MGRIAESRWFIPWAAACCAACVAFATWIANDASTGGRIAAGVVGLVAGIALMFAIPLLFTALPAPPSAPAIGQGAQRPPSPVAYPAPVAPAVFPAPVAPPPDTGVARAELDRELERGRELRGASDQGAVDAWIADAQRAVSSFAPNAAGYFGSLDRRAWDDQAKRLEAHLARLETILRDFL